MRWTGSREKFLSYRVEDGLLVGQQFLEQSVSPPVPWVCFSSPSTSPERPSPLLEEKVTWCLFVCLFFTLNPFCEIKIRKTKAYVEMYLDVTKMSAHMTMKYRILNIKTVING